jgi:Lrp/AsnC family leucine-responsive transcriptional regulator
VNQPNSSMKLDAADMKILRALMENGRASFRQVAKKTSLTTPTVSARIARMIKAGLIRGFVPILSADAYSRGVAAFVTLRLKSSSPEKIAKEFAELRGVEDVYVTAEQSVILKIALENVQELQSFLEKRVWGRPEVSVAHSEVISATLKERPPAVPPNEITMDLRCDFCGGNVANNRPYTISIGHFHRYFCCKTCRKAYLAKYGSKLAKLKAQSQNTSPVSVNVSP